MSGALPLGWAQTTLGEIGRYHNGRAFKPSEWAVSGRPIIRIQDLTGSGGEPHYFGGTVDKRHEIAPGDLLISWAATLGAYVWHGPPAVLNQHTFKVESFVDRLFHYYAAQSVIAALYAKSHGSGMVHVTKGKFEATPIALPPLPEQRRIVEALETYFTRLDAAVATLQRVRANLKRYRAAVLQAAVDGRLVAGCDPNSWTNTSVAELVRDFGYGTSAKCEYDGPGNPVLRIPNVSGGRIDLDDLKFAGNGAALADSDALAPGDFLVIRTNGSRSLIGRAALVLTPLPHPTYFASYLIRLRLRDPERVGRWLSVVWHSPSMRATLEAAAATSAGQYNVGLKTLLGMRVLLPSREEVRRLIAAVDASASVTEACERELNATLLRCARLRQSILRLTFDGRLVPQDPRDEPASVFLDRIRRERPAEAPTPRRKSTRSRA